MCSAWAWMTTYCGKARQVDRRDRPAGRGGAQLNLTIQLDDA